MRRKALLLFIIVFVAGLGIDSRAGAEPQVTDFVCKKCGKPIEGPYFETHGVYYHSDCFVCNDCGRPIQGAYTTYRGGNYHTDCFELNVAKRCSLCDGIIQGEYMFDFWGNAYHLEHRGEIPACEYCGRLIAPQTTGGGVRYSDGRHICNICRKSAVTTRNEAMLILAEVARHMRRFGMNVNIGEVDVHIVGLTEMQQKSGKGSYRLTGFTDFEENKSLFGVTANRRIDIYLLYGMPRIDVVSTMSHELAHVWQFTAGQLNNDTAFSEGSCNYASYLVLFEYRNDEAAAYVISNLESDVNNVYGEGFRRVKRFAEAEGVDEWLKRLKKKDTLPEGY